MVDDLRILRGFVAVAEELNFRKAAERLHMSQPPLSRMISALEDQVNARLFTRSTRSVALSREGLLFLEAAREVLAAAAAAGRKVRHQIGSTDRPLAIGATSSAYFTGFQDLISRFRKSKPAPVMEIAGMNSADQIEALSCGRLDVGFVLPQSSQDGLRAAAFASVRMRLAVPEDHPLAAGGGEVALERFRGETFILHDREQDPGMYEGILRCCTAAGFRPRVRVKGKEEHCMGLVTSGAGVHFSVASSACLQTSGVAFVELAGEAPAFEIHAMWREADPSPALARFLTFAGLD